MTTSTTTSPASPASSVQPHSPTSRRVLMVLALLVAVLAILWYAGVFQPPPRLVIVAANQGPYWELLLRGAQDAADKENVNLTIVRSTGDEAAQTSSLASLLDQSYDGVAVSPNNPQAQAAILAQLGAKTNLITFDSDTPVAGRLCFIGTDNYDAGRMCGQQLRQAVPDGGDVIVCVGSLEKENGQRRRQGLIDELLERPFDPNHASDPDGAPIKGPKYTLLATLVDGIDPARATAMAGDAIDKNPSVKCFVGLFAYNTPAILAALKQKDKLGKVQVIGFDFNDETLSGVDSGSVAGTVVQDAYLIGFESIRILSEVARGDRSQIPLFQVSKISCDLVTKQNLPTLTKKLHHSPTPTTNRS